MHYLKLFLPLFFLSIVACSKLDDNSSNNNGNNTTPTVGTWKITYFYDKSDKTAQYSGYTFTFDANGSFSATNGAQTWSGAWLTGFDDSKNKCQLNLNGSLPSALEDLVEDWLIITIDNSLMHFEHTSGGNGDTDVLKFEKI